MSTELSDSCPVWQAYCTRITIMNLIKTKYFCLFSFIIFLFASYNAHSQILKDKMGIKIGSIDEKGIVKDKHGITVGKFDADGIIKNKNNIKIGKIESDGIIKDKLNIKIGSIDEKGIVKNSLGIKIGKIDKNGHVKDKQGIKIGSAKGVIPAQAAAFWFFNFFN